MKQINTAEEAYLRLRALNRQVKIAENRIARARQVYGLGPKYAQYQVEERAKIVGLLAEADDLMKRFPEVLKWARA